MKIHLLLCTALFTGIAALSCFEHTPQTIAPIHAVEANNSDGLLGELGNLESKVRGAKDLLAQTANQISQKPTNVIGRRDPVPPEPPTVDVGQPTPQPRSVPDNVASIFEWECPPEFDEHKQHTFIIKTDAKFIDPVVRDGYDFVHIHGPVIKSQVGDVRELSYSWTAAPTPQGYGVEVVTFDGDRGITRHGQKVQVVRKTPPAPEPPPGGGSGFGLSNQATTWLQSVRPEDRGNAVEIKAALLSVASKVAQYDNHNDMKAAVGVALNAAIKDKVSWAQFGSSYNAAITALEQSGHIKTPADFAKALTEVAGGL